MSAETELVAAHKIWILFEARPQPGAALRQDPASALPSLDQVSTALDAVAPATTPAATPDNGAPWSKGTITVSRDLSPPLLSALGANAEEAERHRLPVCRASRPLLAAINGARHGSPPDQAAGLLLRLGAKTGAASVPLAVDDIFLIHLENSHSAPKEMQTALLVLRLSLVPGAEGSITALDMLRTVHFLSHDNRKPSLRWQADAAPFRLSDLARSLLQPFGLAPQDSSRLFTYTYAKLPGDAAGADLALRLARHYDENYRIEAPSVLQPFQNIWHATELEGASTIASGETGLFAVPDPANAVQATYLPQVMAAYYEYIILLRLANIASLSAGTDQRATLSRLQEGYLLFRLRNSLPLVSQISLHNRFYAALNNGLNVPLLSRKVAEDVAAATRLLEARSRAAEAHRLANLEEKANRREQRAAILQGLLAGAVAFLTSAAVIKEGGEIAEKMGHGSVPVWQVLALTLAILAAGLAGWFTAVRHRFEHGGGGRADREREDEEFREATNTALEAAAAAKVSSH